MKLKTVLPLASAAFLAACGPGEFGTKPVEPEVAKTKSIKREEAGLNPLYKFKSVDEKRSLLRSLVDACGNFTEYNNLKAAVVGEDSVYVLGSHKKNPGVYEVYYSETQTNKGTISFTPLEKLPVTHRSIKVVEKVGGPPSGYVTHRIGHGQLHRFASDVKIDMRTATGFNGLPVASDGMKALETLDPVGFKIQRARGGYEVVRVVQFIEPETDDFPGSTAKATGNEHLFHGPDLKPIIKR